MLPAEGGSNTRLRDTQREKADGSNAQTNPTIISSTDEIIIKKKPELNFPKAQKKNKQYKKKKHRNESDSKKFMVLVSAPSCISRAPSTTKLSIRLSNGLNVIHNVNQLS